MKKQKNGFQCPLSLKKFYFSEKSAEELEKELNEERAKNAENIKALQQKLTERDLEVKNALAELEKAKGSHQDDDKVKALEEQIKTLTDSLGELSKETKLAKIAEKYPDIAPELLLGKSDEEMEIIANKQKAIVEKNYVTRASSHAPVYSDVNEIDKEMERVKADKTISTETKFQKLGELKEAKANL